MSEIPFVDRLGDELEQAARRADPAPGRPPRRRRFVVVGIAGLAMLTGTAAATGLFSRDDETRAVTPIACYTTADADSSPPISDAAPQTDEIGTSPVELCRRGLARAGVPVPGELVACAGPAQVAVIPGRGSGACRAAGFATLTPGYARAQRRTLQLERDILRIEATADCIAPAQLARRVESALRRRGWTGWRTAVVGPRSSDGACATVSALGGGGQRTFGGSFDTVRHAVLVMPTGSRRLTDLLFSQTGLAGPLITGTGARCYTIDGLRRHVRTILGAKGVDATLDAEPHAFTAGSFLSDADGRMTRYRQGCAIAVSLEPGDDEHAVVVRAWTKP